MMLTAAVHAAADSFGKLLCFSAVNMHPPTGQAFALRGWRMTNQIETFILTRRQESRVGKLFHLVQMHVCSGGDIIRSHKFYLSEGKKLFPE